MLCGFAFLPGEAFGDSDSYDWRSWGTVSDTLATPSEGTRLHLSSPFIQSGSETVIVDGRILTPSQYEINYQRGLVRITSPIADSAVIVVSYVRLPFLLKSVYSLRDIEFADPQEAMPSNVPVARPQQTTFNPTGDLVFGGMKSISLSVGSNRSASLDQSLRATVEGNVTSTIKVRALLSDDNLPIQPEGNTEELEYLDKVFIELSGPAAKATFGDFAFGNTFSNFMSFRRELKGASAEVGVKKTRVGGVAGSAKGVFRSVQFRGTEQLQGPYELLSQGRVTGELIIAGTEQVFFDGALLQRGQNRDYTIDYDLGTIIFTPRRLVTADTEIAVDFEVTQQRYDRTSTFGTLESQDLPAGLAFQTMVGRERDDSERPKSLTLEDADREVLEGAGDNPAAAVTGGVTFVGQGNGHYVLVAGDSTAGIPEHYVFDDSLGAYNLILVEVGVGQGDYLLDGVATTGVPKYRFAGAGNGNYRVGRELPLPQSHSVVATRLTRKGKGGLMFDLQYNVSDFDANTLSSENDDDNIGAAGELQFGLEALPVPFGDLSLIGSVSTLDENFRSLEKTRTWYFYKDWNLEGEPLQGREMLQKLSSAFRRGEALKLEYALGSIRRDNFDGVRHEGAATLRRSNDQVLTGTVLSTDVNGFNDKRTRQHGTISAKYGIGWFLPSVLYETEEYLAASPVRADSGIAYDRLLVSVGSRNAKRFSYLIEAGERNTSQLSDTTNGWVDARTDRTYRLALISRGFRSLNGELQFTHRVQEDRIFDDTQTSDLARLKGFVRLDPFGFRSNFDYEISQNQLRLRSKTVVFVGEGQGDYNQQGELVGTGRGDYTVVFLPTLNTVPTRNVGLTLHMTWKATPSSLPAAGGGLLGWVKNNVSLDQTLSIREETTFDEAYKVYLLFPSALQRNESTLHGLVSLRQDWSFFNNYPNLGLTFQYRRDDEEENRFEPIKEEQFFERQSVRLDRALTGEFTANAQVTREMRQRRGEGLPAGTGSTYNVQGWAVAGGWGLRFSTGTTLDGEVELRKREDSESGAIEDALSVNNRLVMRVSKSLNIFGRYEVTNFTLDNPSGIRPFFFSSTGVSHRWGITPNLKLTKIISFVATYEGRSEDTFLGKRVLEHDFRIETRAFF